MAPTREIEKLQRRWQENPLGLTFAPLAEAYRKEGMVPDALELLDIGLSQHPNYVPAHIVRGRCLLDAGRERDAEAAFGRVTDLDPDNVIALKELADLAERAGRFHEAETHLVRLLEFDRSNEDALLQLDRIKSELATPRPSIDLPPPEVAAAAPLPPIGTAPEPIDLSRPISERESPAEPGLHRAEILASDVPVSAFQPLDLGLSPAAPSESPNPPAESAPVAEDLAVTAELETGRSPAAEPEPPVETAPFVTRSSEPVFELDPSFAEAVETDRWPDSPTPVPVEGAIPLDVGIPGPPSESSGSPEPAEAEPASGSGAPPRAEAGPADERRADLTPPEAAPPEVPPKSPDPEPVAAGRGPTVTPEPPPGDGGEGPAELEAEPDLVVTETMAEIFLRQGHRELALAVYSQLLTRDPTNGRIRSAAERLESELRPAGSAPALPVFAAVLTGGQSVRSFFESLLGATRPDAAPAGGPLSLGAVFGEDRASADSEPAPASAPAAESFDEFFGAEAAPVSDPLPPGPARQTPDPVEDIEEFNSWLKGLKR